MKGIARVLLLAGAAGVVLAAFLPWVTVEGLPLDLDLLRIRISPAGRTVAGTETAAWPGVVGSGALVAVLTLLNLARRLLILLGLVVVLAGGTCLAAAGSGSGAAQIAVVGILEKRRALLSGHSFRRRSARLVFLPATNHASGT